MADANVPVHRIGMSRLTKRIKRRKALDLVLEGCPEGVKWSPNVINLKGKKANKGNSRSRTFPSFEEACSLFKAYTVGSIYKDSF